jgi:hypothetical protein
MTGQRRESHRGPRHPREAPRPQSGLERKVGWSLAGQAGEKSPDGVQRLFTTARWDQDAVRDGVRGCVVCPLGGPDGVLIGDDSGVDAPRPGLGIPFASTGRTNPVTIIPDNKGQGSTQADLHEALHGSDEGITRELLGQMVVSQFEAGRDSMAINILTAVNEGRTLGRDDLPHLVESLCIGVVLSPARRLRLPPPQETVTYIVTGTARADVSYGPSGTVLSGSVPMHVTQPLGTPLYYAINAQLQSGGSLTCEIEVDGQALAHSVAAGGYNIAQCEISQDQLDGSWQSDN